MDDSTPTPRLIDLVQQGDSGAEATLFQRYWPRVCLIVAMRTGRTVSAVYEHEDIAQEALIDAFRRLDDFNMRSEGSFRAWIARIVESQIINHSRAATAARRDVRRRTSLDATGTAPPSVTASPGAQAVGSELEEHLVAAIHSMEPRHRQVIELRRYCEMDFSEIAEEMDLPSSNAASKLFARALARLSDRLERSP